MSRRFALHPRNTQLLFGVLVIAVAAVCLFAQPLSQAIAQETPAVQVPAIKIPAEALPEQPASPPAATDKTDLSPDGAETAVDTKASGQWFSDNTWALITLCVGIVIVLGLIIGFKINAFIALITAAMVVSLMAPGGWGEKIGRVAGAFGSSAGGIGIVIAMAAVIGKCMLDSGAADRIVRSFLRVMGEKRAPMALMGSGFILAVPVFFDTVFYLLVPLARSLHRKTGVHYLKYIVAIAAGGAITHTLVPPTPGPLLMASNLGIDVGVMILIGAIVAIPAAIAGLVFAGIADRLMKTPMRAIAGQPEPDPLSDDELPSLWLSLAPVVLPVVLISISTVLNHFADAEAVAKMHVEVVTDWSDFQASLAAGTQAEGDNPSKLLLNHEKMTDVKPLLLSDKDLSQEEKTKIVGAMNKVLRDKKFYDYDSFVGISMQEGPARSMLSKLNSPRTKPVIVERINRSLFESAFPASIQKHEWKTSIRKAADISNITGNANLALLFSTVIAMWMLVKQRKLTRTELAEAVEFSLMSGGVIILITAGGGAFGAMLGQAQVGPAIQALFGDSIASGNGGLVFLVLGFLIASLLKVAQGSSTVAMIVGSGMMAAMIAGVDLGYHTVYVATAIGAGSLVGSWMNDSGFWIFAKMGGLTEVEALKSWSIMLIILGLVSFGVTIALAMVMPMA